MSWHDYASDSTLQQGELLWECPRVSLDRAVFHEPTEFDVENVHAVIMTQSCDLVRRADGTPKVSTVLLARFHMKSELSRELAFSRASKWEEIRKGRLPRFHVTDRIRFPEVGEDFLLVDLADTFSLNFDLAVETAVGCGTRPRLLPPLSRTLVTGLRSILHASGTAR